jgi:exodeoxyribonuclease VII large subunit
MILTVSELTHEIKKKLEGSFPAISVKGEITNFKEQASGHLYFTLKDAESQISAVLFKGNTRGLKQMPKNGDQVVVKGEINVYPPRGNYQIIVRELQHAGVGELLLKLHELKNKLEKMGWFDRAAKKPLPKMPKRIGVVTSPTGAVIQDIIHVLTRRFSGIHLILNPVKVQGPGSAQEIASAINQFNRYNLADVLIVGRGGGSLEDLWAFNEEIVAEAIFNSKIPIISAVGHETDTSISDFVADVRAPTPSAAAEIVIAEKEGHLTYLAQMQSRMAQSLQQLLRSYRHRLESMAKQPTFSSPYALLGQATQRLGDLNEEIDGAMQRFIRDKKLHLKNFENQLCLLNPSTKITTYREKLKSLAAHLKSIDPKNVLKKGYTLIFREKGDSVIVSSKELAIGEKLRIQFHDGQTTVTNL